MELLFHTHYKSGVIKVANHSKNILYWANVDVPSIENLELLNIVNIMKLLNTVQKSQNMTTKVDDQLFQHNSLRNM